MQNSQHVLPKSSYLNQSCCSDPKSPHGTYVCPHYLLHMSWHITNHAPNPLKGQISKLCQSGTGCQPINSPQVLLCQWALSLQVQLGTQMCILIIVLSLNAGRRLPSASRVSSPKLSCWRLLLYTKAMINGGMHGTMLLEYVLYNVLSHLTPMNNI